MLISEATPHTWSAGNCKYIWLRVKVIKNYSYVRKSKINAEQNSQRLCLGVLSTRLELYLGRSTLGAVCPSLYPIGHLPLALKKR